MCWNLINAALARSFRTEVTTTSTLGHTSRYRSTGKLSICQPDFKFFPDFSNRLQIVIKSCFQLSTTRFQSSNAPCFILFYLCSNKQTNHHASNTEIISCISYPIIIMYWITIVSNKQRNKFRNSRWVLKLNENEPDHTLHCSKSTGIQYWEI